MAQNFVRSWVTTARNEYRDRNDEDFVAFLALLSTLLRHAGDLEMPYVVDASDYSTNS